MPYERMSRQRKYILTAATIGVIALFLPFISWGGLITVNAINYGGVAYLVLIGFLLSAAVCFTHNSTEPLDNLPLAGAVAGGGMAATLLIYYFLRFLDMISYIGIGFYVSIAASIAVLYLSLKFKEATQVTDMEPEEQNSLAVADTRVDCTNEK